MPQQFLIEFQAYLMRAEAFPGLKEPGQYAKYHGRLVKRLDYREFEERWIRYARLRSDYENSIEQGDTINDALVQIIDEYAAELLLPIDPVTAF